MADGIEYLSQVDAEWAKLPSNECPACHHLLDAATNVINEAHRPDDGDYSLCFYCATPLVFAREADGVLRLRMPTPDEWREISSNLDVASARMAAISARYRNRNRENDDG